LFYSSYYTPLYFIFFFFLFFFFFFFGGGAPPPPPPETLKNPRQKLPRITTLKIFVVGTLKTTFILYSTLMVISF
ncbi:hypothetical protein, partial [Chryseobacterium gambrini]|uniref:hypothetical protein n=1 Tax=Chryseobacterium gambrini TaxID=373672 RepID=UPI0025B2D1FF